MLRGGSDNIIPIGVQVEGVQEADRYLETLANRIDKMNGGGVAAPGGSSSFGSLTPPGAPKPGTGLEGYASGNSYASGGTYAPPGMNMGVMSGGNVYTPTSLLSPGALAPNPLTGTTSGGTASGTGGSMTIMAGNVTIVGGGSSPAGGGSSGGGASGGHGGGSANTTPPGSGAPSPASGGVSPLPGGWSPFSQNQNPQVGFTQMVYDHLDNMGQFRGAAASRFLSQDTLGRHVFGGLASMEAFMPAGMASGVAGGLAAAAPWMAGIGLVGGLVAGGMQINNAATLPGYYQTTREMAMARSGQYYDPIQRRTDRQLADSQANEGVYEAWRSNPIGWLGRIGSFGIADAVWSGYIKPGFDRDRTMIQANATYDTTLRDLRRETGEEYVTPDISAYNREIRASESYNRRPWYQKWGRYSFDPLTRGLSVEQMRSRRDAAIHNLQGEAGLSDMLGPYAIGNASHIRGFGFDDYKDATQEQVLRNLSPVLRAMEAPGNESIRRSLFEGKTGIQGGFDTARQSYIFSGDVSSIGAMSLEYRRLYGTDAAKHQRADINAGLRMQESRTAGAIASSELSISRSSVQMAQINGASGYTIAEQTGALAGGYAPILSSLQTQLAAAPNQLERVRLQEQIAQVKVAAQSERRSAEMMRFSTRQTEIGTESSLASTGLQRAMYGSDEGAVVGGFGRQAGATRDQITLLRKMSRSPFISPEERKQYAAQAEAAQNQIDYEIPRQIGGYKMGLRQGEIGVFGAREGVIAQNAGLYGGIGDVYRASLGQTDVTRRQLGLVGQELGGEFGPRTQQERLDLQKQQIDLQRQLNSELEQAKRSYASANLSVSQFSQSMTGAQSGYRQNYFGVGGAAAAGNQGEVVGAARQTLSVAQSNFDAVRDLPRDNPYRQARERELMDAKMGAQNAVQDYARLPVSVDLQRESMAGQFRLSAISRSYMPFGDIRGTVAGLMKNVGAQGKELASQQRAGIAAIDSDSSLTAQEKAERKSVLLRDFESRRYGLGNELLGYQSQLENGWQDRLISSTVGMPGRGTFVASQFTRKEAANFTQGLSSVFGFSGAGAESQRDFFMFRGPRLANSVQGVIQRPDGFNDTAMAMAAGGGRQVLRPSVGGGGRTGAASGVESAARALVEALIGALGNGGNGGNGSNPLGMGASSDVLHHITNNRNFGYSEHANGASHQ